MILEMLDKIKSKFSVEFLANVTNVMTEIRKGMAEENASDDLAYVMRTASSHKNENKECEKRKVVSIYALMIWYKYFRIGKFYVENHFEEDIEKIDLPQKDEIRKILDSGRNSDSKNVKFWSKYAFTSFADT